MAKKSDNLRAARVAKNDEFYTQLSDIEKEMKYYRNYFEGKTIFCNCDDPLESNFTKYFILNFRFLKLKKLICTFYDIKGKTAFAFEYHGEDMNGDGIISEKDIEVIRQSGACRTILANDKGFNLEEKEKCWKNGIYGSGDFRSKNVIQYLKEADIVITNPPFSLFREYVKQLIDYDKKFIIIGNMNAISYKEIFSYIKENKLWLGITSPKEFIQPNGEIKKFGNILWYTNLVHYKRTEPLDLFRKYSIEDYPKYDNYDAIEVSKTCNIPCDYDGIMGVPITFLDNYCPTQFQIIKFRKGNDDKDLSINGYTPYFRILIKKVS